MKKKLRFDKGCTEINISVDTDYFIEVAQALWSRRQSTKIDYFSLLESMGADITDMTDRLEHLNIMNCEKSFEDLADKNKEFLIKMAILIKFLSPLIEQLDTSIDKHISVEND